jgi:glycosyltransferase involved in cell wall biosynthesis
LKILMIAPTAFFSSRGGHLRILGEVVALTRLGYSVALCAYGVGDDVPNVKIFRGKLKPRNFQHGPSKLRPLLDIDLLLTSIRSYIREKPDIIHGHLHEGAAIASILSVFTRTPVVLDAQGSISEETVSLGLARRGSLLHRLLKVFELLTIRKASAVMASSNQLVESYRSRLPLNQRSKLMLVLDGFDNSHFRPLPKNHDLQKQLRIREDKKVVVYLGSLEKQQGITMMIEAAGYVLKQRSDVHFLMMGTPVDISLGECRELAEKNRVSNESTFLGTVPYELAPKYLSLGDVAISAKVSKSEANGKVCVYMAMGLPTVCFDTPTNRDLLGDLGFFANGPTPGSLARQILVALDAVETRGDKLRNQLSKRANEVASWDSMASHIIKSYYQVLN